MRYGILADIHGNLEAFNAVIEACRNYGVRQFFCLGDIVGYGANPKECIALVRENKMTTVAGNHDWAACGRLDREYFNPTAKEAIIWTAEHLTNEEKSYLYNLELTFTHKEFILVHGTLNQPEEFHYLTDIDESMDTFYLMDRGVCFVGHTHVPQIFVKDKDNVDFCPLDYVEVEGDGKYIVNVGSVGQPRDGNPMAAYGIYDPDLKRIEIKRVPYDVKAAQKKILEASLPEMLASRLTIGQ